MYKELFSALAIALTLVAFLPYIRAILRGGIRPHLFSWIIWGSTTFVVFLAQLADRGGLGAWPIGVSGLLTLVIAWLAWLKRGDCSITRSDWFFLSVALTSLPLWYLTADPLWAVVVLTFVDTLGFGPTIRKAYAHPFEEQRTFYLLFAVRNALAIAALENYSLTTLLFPVITAAGCLFLIAVISTRRVALARP